MPKLSHIEDAELLAYADREVASERLNAIEQHLAECAVCRDRLAVLEQGAQTYQRFHTQVLLPSLVPASWQELRFTHQASPKKLRSRIFSWPAVLAASAALAAVILLLVPGTSQSRRMSQVLVRAEAVRTNTDRGIKVTADGMSWIRPASSRTAPSRAGLKQIGALFIKADYNWNDPLSARSFAAWRKHLRDKRDHVERLQASDARDALYVIRTDTSDSSLRSASLTLRAGDLNTVGGEFRFEHNQDVQMADIGILPASQPRSSRPAAPPQAMRPAPITAADELRVLAALDQIGADVNDAITVETDPAQQHVVVTGIGVRPSRQAEIRKKLMALPRAVVHFVQHQYIAHSAVPDGSASFSSNSNPRSYGYLEGKAGGPAALESISGEALDASSAVLAHAHALDVLAGKFPPGVETTLLPEDRATLLQLRRNHAQAIERNDTIVLQALQPFFSATAATPEGTDRPRETSWQSDTARLYELARTIDDNLGRLLDALYSEEESKTVLTRLPHELEDVRRLARGAAQSP